MECLSLSDTHTRHACACHSTQRSSADSMQYFPPFDAGSDISGWGTQIVWGCDSIRDRTPPCWQVIGSICLWVCPHPTLMYKHTRCRRRKNLSMTCNVLRQSVTLLWLTDEGWKVFIYHNMQGKLTKIMSLKCIIFLFSYWLFGTQNSFRSTPIITRNPRYIE